MMIVRGQLSDDDDDDDDDEDDDEDDEDDDDNDNDNNNDDSRPQPQGETTSYLPRFQTMNHLPVFSIKINEKTIQVYFSTATNFHECV